MDLRGSLETLARSLERDGEPILSKLGRKPVGASRTLKLAGYDSIYLAHGEDLSVPWLTADDNALRRLRRDPRAQPLIA